MELHARETNPLSTLTLKVLIADDDAPTRMLLRAAISQWGEYEIVEASDGEEAWGIMQTIDAPRLLILDWMMPKIDGVTLCQRSKELPNRPYIILLTQVSGTTNIVKGLEAGANEFLSKPFNMAELRSRLSIGAKIIEFENKLSAQNAQLQISLSQLEPLLLQTLEDVQELYDELQVVANVTSHVNLSKVEKLHDELHQMVKLINKLKLNS